MKTICMDCKVVKSDDGKNDGKTSHGICEKCLKKRQEDCLGNKKETVQQSWYRTFGGIN